mgnify:CR=1 FL=1
MTAYLVALRAIVVREAWRFLNQRSRFCEHFVP